MIPLTVIGLLVPIVLLAYEPWIPDVLKVTVSPETTPFICAALVSICDVAEVVESYTREVVVSPLTVKVFALTTMVTVAESGS